MDKRRTRSPEKRYLGFFARIEDESDVALLDKMVRNLHGSSNRFLIHELLRTAVKARPEMFL
jgi:hypothetical protein